MNIEPLSRQEMKAAIRKVVDSAIEAHEPPHIIRKTLTA
jgi:hypothetical protein